LAKAMGLFDVAGAVPSGQSIVCPPRCLFAGCELIWPEALVQSPDQ